MSDLLARFGLWLFEKFGGAPPALPTGEYHIYATFYRGSDGAVARATFEDPSGAVAPTLYSRQGLTIRGVKPLQI